MSNSSHVTVRTHSFLSSIALGLSAIIITMLVSGTVVVLYTVDLASEKTDQVVAIVQGAISGLPDFQESLPPAVGDLLNDRREPGYRKDLTVTASLVSAPDRHGMVRTAIEIVNNGDEVVSLMSLRINLFNEKGQLISTAQEWAATPLSIDNDWRGPILPDSRRYFVCRRSIALSSSPFDQIKTEVEINELRVWNGESTPAQPDIRVPGVDEATAAATEPQDVVAF